MISPQRMAELDEALKAVAPVLGATVRDMAVARIDFTAEATEQQKSAAWAIARGFDLTAQSQSEQEATASRAVLNQLRTLSLAEFRALTAAQKETVLYHLMRRELRRLG